MLNAMLDNELQTEEKCTMKYQNALTIELASRIVVVAPPPEREEEKASNNHKKKHTHAVGTHSVRIPVL